MADSVSVVSFELSGWVRGGRGRKAGGRPRTPAWGFIFRRSIILKSGCICKNLTVAFYFAMLRSRRSPFKLVSSDPFRMSSFIRSRVRSAITRLAGYVRNRPWLAARQPRVILCHCAPCKTEDADQSTVDAAETVAFTDIRFCPTASIVCSPTSIFPVLCRGLAGRRTIDWSLPGRSSGTLGQYIADQPIPSPCRSAAPHIAHGQRPGGPCGRLQR